MVTTVSVATSVGWFTGVSQAYFAFDGRIIVLLSDYKVWAVDAVSGKTMHPLISHKDQIYALAVSDAGKGRWLALSGGGGKQVVDGKSGIRFDNHFKDYSIRLWDVGQRKVLKAYSGHQDTVLGLAFRPKTRHFVSGSYDQTVCLWDWESGKLLRTYRGHAGPVRSVAVSPDGRRAVSGGDDCKVHFWELPALPADFLVAIEKSDTDKLQKTIRDMDTMGAELGTAFAPLVQALRHDKDAMRSLVTEGLLQFATLWRDGALPSFQKSDHQALTTLLQATDNPKLLTFAAEGLSQAALDGAKVDKKADAALATAKTTLESGNIALTRTRLQIIIQDFPGTSAAIEAAALLKQLGK